MNYTVDYISKPVTPERVQELIDQMDKDLVKLERVESLYGTADTEYQRLADRLQNTYYLAEDLARQLGIDDPDGDDLEVKDFSSWANKQIELSDGWNW